jgi:sigma-54 dependent transcriptional regulator, acetoin dehydrogenase operon transcriptional activator AcoR
MLTKDLWEKFIRGLPSESVPEIILDSWQRSKKAGIDYETPSFRRIAPDDLQALLLAQEDLIRDVVPEMQRLSSFLPRPNVVYLVDPEGTVLHAISTNPDMIEKYGLAPGSIWSEKAMGTNGAGTALVSRKPVAVIGCAHFCAAWHDAACLASPLFGVQGALVGAIDATIPAQAAQPLHLAEVVRSALEVERHLRSDEAGQKPVAPSLGSRSRSARRHLQRST